MSQQGSHKPTEKRVREFRKRGEIARSPDLSSQFALSLGAIALVAVSYPAFVGAKHLLSHVLDRDLNRLDVAWRDSIELAVKVCVPVFLAAIAGFLVAAGMQLGWPPAIRGIKLDFTKIFSPGSIAQVFSPKAAIGRGAKTLAKTSVVIASTYIVLRQQLNRLIAAPALDADELAHRIGSNAWHLSIAVIATTLGIATLDFFIAKRRLSKKMMMSGEEMKREHREQEGDPIVKGQRKRKARELAKRRLNDVKRADVILVNPTEYAVALRYATGKDRAPIVVAKGKGSRAERIRALARSAGVPIVRRPPLTRFLFRNVSEGKEIPSAVYHAVAEVLAYVYRLREPRR